jgi:hypothetical protein
MNKNLKQAARMIKESLKEDGGFFRIELIDDRTYSCWKTRENKSQLSLTGNATLKIVGESRVSCCALSKISNVLTNFGINTRVTGDGHGSQDNVLEVYGSYLKKTEGNEEQNRRIIELIKEINRELGQEI